MDYRYLVLVLDAPHWGDNRILPELHHRREAPHRRGHLRELCRELRLCDLAAEVEGARHVLCAGPPAKSYASRIRLYVI